MEDKRPYQKGDNPVVDPCAAHAFPQEGGEPACLPGMDAGGVGIACLRNRLLAGGQNTQTAFLKPFFSSVGFKTGTHGLQGIREKAEDHQGGGPPDDPEGDRPPPRYAPGHVLQGGKRAGG